MEKTTPNWTLASIAELLGGQADGPPDLPVSRPVSAGDDDPEGIAFAESEEYLRKVESSNVAAVLIGPDEQTSKPAVRVESPRAAFFKLLHLANRPMALAPGIHQSAAVDGSAQVDPTAQIGAFAVVGAGSTIGRDARIHPHAVVSERCEVGAQSVLYPHATLYPDVRIGERCVVHSGAVVGADGFGFIWDGRQRIKIPQVGGVRIGDDVEIGANTCIDRATAGDTIIEDGSKLDNLVQVGHNAKLGRHVVIAGQSGMAGSVTIGDRTVLAGRVVVNDHVAIGADVTLGGRSGVEKDIEEPGEYFGTPARPAREALRTFLLVPRLPELWARLRKLERKLGEDE